MRPSSPEARVLHVARTWLEEEAHDQGRSTAGRLGYATVLVAALADLVESQASELAVTRAQLAAAELELAEARRPGALGRLRSGLAFIAAQFQGDGDQEARGGLC